MPDQFTNYWARMGARGRNIPNTASVLPRRAPAVYGTDQAYQQLLLEQIPSGDNAIGQPTGIGVEPDVLTGSIQPIGSLSVGGNITGTNPTGDFYNPYPQPDFGGTYNIAGDLPSSPFYGPTPFYGDISKGGTFGFDPSIDWGAPLPESPFYGPSPTYDNPFEGARPGSIPSSDPFAGARAGYIPGADTGDYPSSSPGPAFSDTTATSDSYPSAIPVQDWVNNAARGGNTDNTGGNAAQNWAYWAAINGVGLSNPSFYPGGGIAYNLNTPGGIQFNAMGTGPGDLGGFVNNQARPLTRGQYNAFQYPASIPKPSYENYATTFPAVSGNAPSLGGRGSKLAVSNQ